MIERTLVGDCDGCGRDIETTMNDLEDPGEDTSLPPAWVALSARRVWPNPAHTMEREAVEAVVQAQLAQLPEDAPPPPADTVEALRMAAEAQLGLTEPPFIVQEMEGCYCPKCAGNVQTRMGLEDW